MRGSLKLGLRVIFKAITLAMLVGAVMVFMGGLACAQEKSVTEEVLDILLKNHQISQEKYDELLKRAEAEKMAEAKRIAEEQKQAIERQHVPPLEPEKTPNLNVWWFNGLQFQSADNQFNLHIGGRGELDFADAEPDSNLAKWASGASVVKGGNAFSEPQTSGYGDQFRRVRLEMDGTIYNTVEFMVQPDFVPSYESTQVVSSVSTTSKGGNTTSITARTTNITQGTAISYADVRAGIKDIPYLGRIWVGQMEEPFSLEEMTRDNFRTFMENGLPTAFVPKRNAGAMEMDTVCDNRLGWMVGYFFQQQAATSSNGVPQDTTADLFSPHLDATQFAGRITGLPWYGANGQELVHIGVGYTHLFRSNSSSSSNAGTLDFKTGPESNLFNPLVDTGNFLAKSVDIVGPEFAMVYGPFSVQAEYVYAAADHIRSTSGTFLGPRHDADFYGWYAYATYFLTGEHRPYNKVTDPRNYQGSFARVYPYHNFDPVHGGCGAWELAFRVSQLDTNDIAAGFNGGKETDYTVGLNWYLNPYVEVYFNYIHAVVDGHNVLNSVTNPGANGAYGGLPFGGTDNIFETRFQIAF